MKNRKGFTVVELGVSICLVTVVSLLLFQLITAVKKTYTVSDLKTTLLTKQAIMTKKIYDDLGQKKVSTITNCDIWQNSCLKFTFSDNTTSTLMVDPLKLSISYNNYTINYREIDDSVEFGELFFKKTDTFFTIKIPITSFVSGNYGIYVTKQQIGIIDSFGDGYVAGGIAVPMPDTNNMTAILNDGTDYWLVIYDSDYPTISDAALSYLKYLKIEPCSVDTISGNAYELKTPTSNIRWCQTNNFYTQDASVGKFVAVPTVEGGAVYVDTALGKSTYKEALTDTSTLKDHVLYLKVTSFVNKYTFKSR